MSAPVLLNLLNKLYERYKICCLPSIVSLFCNKFSNFNNKSSVFRGKLHNVAGVC